MRIVPSLVYGCSPSTHTCGQSKNCLAGFSFFTRAVSSAPTDEDARKCALVIWWENKKKNSSQQLRCVLSDPVYLTWWLWTWLHLHHLKVRGFSCDSQCVFWPLLFHFCSPWCAHWPVVPWPLLLTFANKSIYLTSEGLLQSPPSNTLTYNLFHRCEGAVMCKTGVFFTDWMKLQPLCLCRCLNEFLNLTTIFVWAVYEMSTIWLNCQICAKTCSLSTWFRSTAKNNDVWTIFLYEDMLFVPNASQQVSSVNVSKHIV